MAPRQQADQQPLEHRILADDHAFYLVQNLLQGVTGLASVPVVVLHVHRVSFSS